MADLVFNIAKGRVAELYRRVDLADPANAVLVVVAIVANGQTDAVIRDYDTLSDLLGDALVAEATNSGYARIVINGAALAAFAADDTNDRVDLDTADLAFGAISAGDNWTDLVICYDPDSTGGTDATIVPLTLHDFPITADGSAVTATVAGFFRAS